MSIHIKNNECPICLEKNLGWDLDICKSDMHMFKCGHGTCKACFNTMRSTTQGFSCPMCRDTGQEHYLNFMSNRQGMWLTFAEWYNEYEIYIKAGAAKNIIYNSSFGKQLLRLAKESRKKKKQNHTLVRTAVLC